MNASTTTPQTVDVIAPSDLNAGYQFHVDAQGQTLTVKVPPEGVKAGQRFTATVLQASVAPTSKNGPPTGHWRDEWTNCCSKIDPMCCLGFWCSSCLVGQIMTRLNLDWKGDRFSSASTRPSLSTFKIVFIITLVYHVLARVFAISGLWLLEVVFFILFALYFTLIGCKTRNLIRRTYNIPTTTCDDKMEDCCCAWCSCCTACHMARHLTDYTVHKAECCTDTGLGHDAPVLTEFAIPSGAPTAGLSTTVGSTPPPVLEQSNPTNSDDSNGTGGSPTAQNDEDDDDRRNEATYMVDI